MNTLVGLVLLVAMADVVSRQEDAIEACIGVAQEQSIEYQSNIDRIDIHTPTQYELNRTDILIAVNCKNLLEVYHEIPNNCFTAHSVCDLRVHDSTR